MSVARHGTVAGAGARQCSSNQLRYDRLHALISTATCALGIGAESGHAAAATGEPPRRATMPPGRAVARPTVETDVHYDAIHALRCLIRVLVACEKAVTGPVRLLQGLHRGAPAGQWRMHMKSSTSWTTRRQIPGGACCEARRSGSATAGVRRARPGGRWNWGCQWESWKATRCAPRSRNKRWPAVGAGDASAVPDLMLPHESGVGSATRCAEGEAGTGREREAGSLWVASATTWSAGDWTGCPEDARRC